jgi:hypothetical protein
MRYILSSENLPNTREKCSNVIILLILWIKDGWNVKLLILNVNPETVFPVEYFRGFTKVAQENAGIVPQVRYTTTPFYVLSNS